MATSKLALSGRTPAVPPAIISDPNEKAALDQAIQRQVSERAYRLFQASNAAHGKDQEHWLQAESEILQHGLEIRESGSWLSINAWLPDVSADNVRIYLLEPSRVIVRTQKTSETQDVATQTQSLAQQDTFLLSDLTVEVDAATASASLKDQKLTIMVKKRYPVASPTTQTRRTSE
jgi:HSP20 family molecular chaperone IbpA